MQDNKEKLTSLIMPVWNQLEHTTKALASLKLYTDVPYELIIINNGSNDSTSEYLDKNWSSQPNVQVIHNTQNLGWTKALNQGVKIAKGDFIGILNNDILFSRNWLRLILRHFDDPTVGAVGPTSNMVSGRQKVQFNDGYRSERANHLIGFCLIFRKELIEKVGTFDERFFATSEEIDYAIRVRKETTWKMEIARDVFVWHKGFTSLNALPEVKGDASALNSFHSRMTEKNIAKWGKEEIHKIYQVPPKVLIAVPHTGFIPVRHYTSMLRLESPPITEFLDISRAPVQTARNLAVKFAIEINAEYLFFIDSDAIVTPDLLMRLLKHDKDIVGIIAYTRNKPYFPCVFRRRKDNHDDWASIDSRNHGLLSVDGIGAHALLIHSRVFNTLKSPWFEFAKFGEDLMFCEKAREAGFKIWCDTTITLPHISENAVVDERTFVAEKERKEAEEKEQKGKVKEEKDGKEVESDPRRRIRIPVI